MTVSTDPSANQPSYSFRDDYSTGAHPDILAALATDNTKIQTPYGEDEYTLDAQRLIRERMNSPDAAVHFVASGTMANITCIGSCLRPHEAVIAASSGHIVVRETGAIEAIGHKIINVHPVEGKLTPRGILKALQQNTHYPHMSRPRLVYISNTTEVGTVYSKAELTAIKTLCEQHGLLLHLDGARLGAALAAEGNDITLEDYGRLTDIFWIGGTKVGTLLGEAIVINNPALREDFAFHIKQRGGLLAKGRVLGLQFQALFRSSLFFDLALHANATAKALSTGITEAGYKLAAATESNQVFAIVPETVVQKLQHNFEFYIWENMDDGRLIIRLVTSWATEMEGVEAFIASLKMH